MEKLILKNTMPKGAEHLKGVFLTDNDYDVVIGYECDAYDVHGNLLFRYRKNAIDMALLKLGYESFKDSIQLTDGRGIASGSSHKRVRKDGSISNITVGNKVYSGNVGYMDANAMVHYCRKTAFARDYFDQFTAGIPFVQKVDKLYAELCPEHYKKQIAIATGTNRNYRIADTAFTTVTVNRNFATAVHKDAGDYPEGFGNLCVYREGHYSGSYFCLPEYRVAIDMQNGDILFADVHRWHGNTPFKECSDDYLRIAFVMYYREYMYKCRQPSEELNRVKMEKTGFLTL
jgi:hypothetical protein